MIGGSWFRNLAQGHLVTKIKTQRQKAAVTAVICNGTTRLCDDVCNLEEELNWLVSTGKENSESYGAVYYHDKGAGSHHYQLLPQKSLPDKLNQYNHILRRNKALTVHSELNVFANYAKENEGKVLLATTGKHNINGVYENSGPYVHTELEKNLTYSFTYHGSIKRDDLLLIPGYTDWLNSNNPQLLNATRHDDGEYLFYWIIKNIREKNNDVLAGLHKALSVIHTSNLDGQINIIFSDGTGAFAYTNGYTEHENGYFLSYKIARTVNSISSYIIRNTKDLPGIGWTSLKERSLYYFPTQGAMLIYINIDTAQYTDLRFKPGYNWVCFSQMCFG